MAHFLQLLWDEAIQYKSLKFYPVTMEHYYQFQTAAQVLVIEKNSIPDSKIISMTYLSYVYQYSTEQNQYMLLLDYLLKLCLRLDMGYEIRYTLDERDGSVFFEIDGEKFSAEDFEEIKNIVCEQNDVELPDDTISKDVRDAYEEAKRYKAKLSGKQVASLEDLIICVMISTSLKLEDIKQLSIRKFRKILEREDLKLHYQIYLSAAMSGMVKFKDDSAIQHWMTDLIAKDKFADVRIERSEIEKKIGGK